MNWDGRIKRAQRRGRFFHADGLKAADWLTCACGEQDPRIPRHSGGTPIDRKLNRRGVMFARVVFANDFNEAAQLLALIEERAAELLQEVQA